MSQRVNVRAASWTERRAASTQHCRRDGGERGRERGEKEGRDGRREEERGREWKEG